MGSQETSTGAKTEIAWQVEKRGQVFTEFDEVPAGHHFSNSDPGWDRKGQQQERKLKTVGKGKNLNDFYWIL